MVERYVAAAGRQEWQTFHPRGMRYLEVLVRGDLGAFELHEVGLTRANYPASDAGAFECSDPMLTRLWQMGRETLHACMEDAYVDCPWRERGLYSGDFYVQFHVNLAACGDFSLFRRCIDLFLQGQGPSGTLPGCALGVAGHGASDYSMIIPQAMRAYAQRSGDRDFLGRRAGHVARLMTGLAGQVRPGEALMDGAGLGPYIDIAHFDKGGVSASLNCFYQRTLADAAWIMDRVGRPSVAEAFAKEARRVAEAIRAGFWDEARGAFVDRLRADVPATGPSVQANALAILYGIAAPEQAARAADWLAAAMLDNFRGAEPRGPEDCNVSTYFAFYALGALYRCGKVREAEAFIRTYWGRMIDRGAWTFWEYFTDNASLCHAWSACPTYYLSSEVLGVTMPDPDHPDRIAIRPHPGTLSWARGTWPHARGPIRVSWRRKDDGTAAVEYEAPEGVEIVP